MITPLQKAVLLESKRSLFNYHEHLTKHFHARRGSTFADCVKCDRTQVRVLKAALLINAIFPKEN